MLETSRNMPIRFMLLAASVASSGCKMTERATPAQDREVLPASIEFRILAERSRIDPEIIDAPASAEVEAVGKYLSQLEQHGAACRSDDQYMWIELAPESRQYWEDPVLVMASRENVSYVLAANNPASIMLDDGSWALSDVSLGRDGMDRPSINLTFDERGGAKMASLTRDNMGRPLASIIDGQAVSFAMIRSQIHRRAQISGLFPESRAQKLVFTLRGGVSD